jgi:hypothetical protein
MPWHVSVRFAMLFLVPFILLRFLSYCQSLSGMEINPQLRRISVLVFYGSALVAAGLYPLLVWIEFRGVSEPFFRIKPLRT